MSDKISKRKCTTSTATTQDVANTEENKTNDLNQKPVIKRNRYSFEDKRNILEDSKNLTSHELSKKYNVNSCLIRKWKSKSDDIKDAADKSRTKNMKKISTSVELDNLLFNWMCDCRSKGFPVSGPMLKNQALVICKEIGHSEDFHASNGWLEKWKKRMNIKSLKITGEKLSADEEAASIYIQKFAELINERTLNRSQIFNMDESGLMYKSIPKRNFVSGDYTQVSSSKKQLERITIATCCNADGSCKLPLIVIGKAKNPHCLRNVNKNLLPVWYRNQTNAWMNLEIFEEWFKDVFVPTVKSFLINKNFSQTAILIVDNCRSHKYMNVDGIEIHLFPPNETALIQPMDQGIIQALKLNYQKHLVEEIFKAQNQDMDLINFLKTINLYNVILWVAAAWEEVDTATIFKCLKNLWPVILKDVTTQTDANVYCINTLDVSVDTDVIPSQLSHDEHVNDLLHILRKVKGYEDINAEAVLNWTKNTDEVASCAFKSRCC